MQAEPRLGGFVISVHSLLSYVKQDLNNHPVSNGISPSFNLDTEANFLFMRQHVNSVISRLTALLGLHSPLSFVKICLCAKPIEEVLTYASSALQSWLPKMTRTDTKRHRTTSSATPQTSLLCTVNMGQKNDPPIYTLYYTLSYLSNQITYFNVKAEL